MSRKVLSVVGPRPNCMKVGLVHRMLLASEADCASRVLRILAVREPSGHVPPLWDGRAARRILEVLEETLA